VQEIAAYSLRAEIFKRRGPLVRRAIIELVRAAGKDPANAELVSGLHRAMRDGLILSLEWYAERRMYPFMSPLLDLYGEYLTTKESTVWRERITELECGVAAQRGRIQGDARLRVSMLGTITVQRSGEEPQRVSGARRRTLLGLMVADRMLDKPLDQGEFRRLAAGGEEELHNARKAMNMGVHRLREAIGDDGVLTDEETPRLNMERVQVDLLDAVGLVRAARDAFREGAMLRAWPALVQALEITRGEVSFPTLYDDFFEAAREDFEFELRSAIIDISRGLLAEGDAAAAEQILRRGFDAMPEDEEVSELLCRALESSGKRTAAERVRMQAAEV
jgi:DNA-binding SARP family transcriptional activator